MIPQKNSQPLRDQAIAFGVRMIIPFGDAQRLRVAAVPEIQQVEHDEARVARALQNRRRLVRRLFDDVEREEHRHGAMFYLRPGIYAWVSVAIALLLFWRHRANIRQLLSGRETTIGR